MKEKFGKKKYNKLAGRGYSPIAGSTAVAQAIKGHLFFDQLLKRALS